jgi:tripartite-type tricarboxylate transporter receptor subunit TctC
VAQNRRRGRDDLGDISTALPPDGLTTGQTSASLYFQQHQPAEVQFDWRKFSWIGSAGLVEALLMMRTDAPYKSIEDPRRRRAADTRHGAGSSGHISLRVLEEAGREGAHCHRLQAAAIKTLAIERGEVQCRSVSSASFPRPQAFISWQKNCFIRILIQSGRKRNPKNADAPTIYELMTRHQTPEAKQRVVMVLLGADQFGQYLAAAPPGTPAERVKILREAYTRALKDPDLIEEAKRRNWSMEHNTGEELQELAKQVIDQPPQLIGRVKELLGGN